MGVVLVISLNRLWKYWRYFPDNKGDIMIFEIFGLQWTFFLPFWHCQNLANPTALLLSAVMMLRHLNLNDQAEQIHNAILTTISEGKYRTADLGGTSSTSDFTKAVCDNLWVLIFQFWVFALIWYHKMVKGLTYNKTQFWYWVFDF